MRQRLRPSPLPLLLDDVVHLEHFWLTGVDPQLGEDRPQPCPERVEQLHARPDGHHFTPTAATWAARWILTETLGTAR